MDGWRMVDRIDSVEPGVRAVGSKTFSADTFFFSSHFPGYPTVPGVLEIEMIAQTAYACIRKILPDSFGMLTHVRFARFVHRIEPGQECMITTEVKQLRPRHALVGGTISVAGRKVGEAEILLALISVGESTVNAANLGQMRSDL